MNSCLGRDRPVAVRGAPPAGMEIPIDIGPGNGFRSSWL